MVRLTQSRQLGAVRKHRLSQLEGTFVVTKPKLIDKANILLMDEVVTTGATQETVAKLLGKSGAISISGLVFAQK